MRKIIISIISIIASVFGFVFFIRNVEMPKKELTILIVSCAFLFLSAIFFVLFLYRNKNKKIKWLENRLEVWNNISYHVNQAGDEVFNELPVGILIYDENFEIKWANRYAKSAFQSRLIDSSVDTIKENISMSLKAKEKKLTIKVDNRYFDVIHNSENRLLYFFEETKREETVLRYQERITAIGIIMIDNLEESLKKYDMQEKSTIRGQFLGELSDWVREYGAYLQNYSEDRLVMVLDRESLDKMIETKFDILNKVRDISSNNHLKASVSIGIACYDVEHDELGTLAQNAIELAEKRGGDQVVVNIQNEKIQYFGGKTNSTEKNSLVQARVQTMALKEAVESASNVYISTHFLADCDALGSMLGVYRMVEACGKDVKIVFDPQKADFTVKKIYELIKQENEDLIDSFVNINEVNDIKNNTLLIMCDTQSPKIAMFPELISKIANLAVIDHHRSGDEGYNNPIVSYVETYVSSTVELVSEMFMFLNREISITGLEASIMLAGLVVDTNNFTFRTGSRTFEAASTLRERGADMVLVRTLLRDSIEVEQELASALLNVELFLDRFAIVTIPQNKVVEDRTLLAKISERLLSIEGVDAAFTIGKLDKESSIGISARSYETVNVQLIMEEMGGGGHFNSAACQIKDKSSIEIRDELCDIIRREYEDLGDVRMKVILLSDIKGKGKKDQIIDVATGYGNYLLTNKLAIVATDENIKALKDAEEKARIDAENHKKLMEKLKSEIEAKSINIYIKVGNDGKTFGHVTTKQICEEFEAQTGIHLDKRKVELPVEINSLGIYQASVTLHRDVVATINVNVIEK